MTLPSNVEALDIGCGDGKSTLAVATRLAIEGQVVGLDRQQTRLPDGETPVNISFLPVDAMDLPNSKLAQVSTLYNVLPGLPNAAAVLAMLRKAAIVSRDFVFVSQVQFDATPHLIRRGFKTYYSDLSSNRYQGGSFDYLRMMRSLFDEGLIADYALLECERIRDSSDPVVHALQSPPDSGPYDAGMHRHKTLDVPFSEPIFKRMQLILCRKPAQLGKIARRLKALEKPDNVIYSTMPI